MVFFGRRRPRRYEYPSRSSDSNQTRHQRFCRSWLSPETESRVVAPIAAAVLSVWPLLLLLWCVTDQRQSTKSFGPIDVPRTSSDAKLPIVVIDDADTIPRSATSFGPAGDKDDLPLSREETEEVRLASALLRLLSPFPGKVTGGEDGDNIAISRAESTRDAGNR